MAKQVRMADIAAKLGVSIVSVSKAACCFCCWTSTMTPSRRIACCPITSAASTS